MHILEDIDLKGWSDSDILVLLDFLYGDFNAYASRIEIMNKIGHHLPTTTYLIRDVDKDELVVYTYIKDMYINDDDNE